MIDVIKVSLYVCIYYIPVLYNSFFTFSVACFASLLGRNPSVFPMVFASHPVLECILSLPA